MLLAAIFFLSRVFAFVCGRCVANLFVFVSLALLAFLAVSFFSGGGGICLQRKVGWALKFSWPGASACLWSCGPQVIRPILTVRLPPPVFEEMWPNEGASGRRGTKRLA